MGIALFSETYLPEAGTRICLDALPCNRFISEPADRALSASLATAPMVAALYEHHELARFLDDDAAKIRAYLGGDRPYLQVVES